MSRVIPQILKENEGATEEKGENARISKFVGAVAVSDLIKTTLGPKGMDKILQAIDENGVPSKNVTITNDGATILKSVLLDNPAAKILVDISKTQDDDIGDGTTSVVVLAGELLKNAERLVESKIHPQTIIRGWRHALDTACATLLDSSVPHTNPKKLKEVLYSIAKTSLSSKILSGEKDHFAKICVDAILHLKEKEMDLDNIYIIKKEGGSLRDSFLAEGFILDKSIGIGQPTRLENPKILVANTPMDTDKIKIFGAKIKTSSLTVLADIETAEKMKMKNKVEKILKHKINCFVNRQLIYDYPEQLFADKTVMSIEHADFEGVERLALALGADIASTFDHPEKTRLGSCKLIEEIMVGDQKMVHFSGVSAGKACTIVIRGGGKHLLDEIERSLHDALCVVSLTAKDGRTIFGGGCSEIMMAKDIERLAPVVGGKEQLAVESFAQALKEVVAVIAQNAGFDRAEIVANLRAAHYRKDTTAGIDMATGSVGDMSELDVKEPYLLKRSILLKAHEAAEMILRADEIIRCAPRPRDKEPCM